MTLADRCYWLLTDEPQTVRDIQPQLSSLWQATHTDVFYALRTLMHQGRAVRNWDGYLLGKDALV